ncbi:MAG: HemK2/MTQ2 family protein methyltransferase [archaeon]
MKQKISKEVYSPAEDSWLLEECILKENLKGKKCLDLGTGSGIQSIAMLKAGAEKVLAVDINSFALKEARKNIGGFIKENKKSKTQFVGHILGVQKSDLFSSIKLKFDFIAFNPPYVPSDEVKWVDLDGGENGRVVIDRFLPQVKTYLNKNAFALLLVSSLNKPNEIKKALEKLSFSVKVVGRKKLFFEELLVLRISLK